MLGLVIALLPGTCLLDATVEGPVVASFAPEGAYGGHWGIDVAVPEGTAVRAMAGGIVTFSGRVGNRWSVTVHHGGSVRTSYSYLATPSVAEGDPVERGHVLGVSGMAHGMPAVHVSLRVGDRYLDPAGASCGSGAPAPGVRLVGVV